MAGLMQDLIAEAIRVITEKLRSPSDRDPDDDTSVVTRESILDVSMADAVRGSFIFSDPECNVEPDWCVLVLHGTRADGSAVYRFQGRVRSDLGAVAFVERIYELILMRRVDESGRDIYPHLLETFVLTKRDVIRILVESPEAQTLDARFVIVPEPSSWLSNIGVPQGSDSEFPLLIVKGSE